METDLIDKENDLQFVFSKNQLDEDSSDEFDQDEGEKVDPELPVTESDEQLGKRPVPGVKRKTKKSLKKGKIQIQYEEPDENADEEMIESLQQFNF